MRDLISVRMFSWYYFICGIILFAFSLLYSDTFSDIGFSTNTTFLIVLLTTAFHAGTLSDRLEFTKKELIVRITTLLLLWTTFALLLAPIYEIYIPISLDALYFSLSLTLVTLLGLIVWLRRTVLTNSQFIHTEIMKSHFFIITSLAAITILGFVLRAWNLDYVQGADTFNINSSLAFFQSGSFSYPRNLHITYIVAGLFSIFGQSMFVARIYFVIVGALSIPVMYLIGAEFNKTVGLISAFLLAISPVSIEESSFVREYAELLFLSLLVTYTLLRLFAISKNSLVKYCKVYLPASALLVAAIFIYSSLVKAATLKSVILLVAVFGLVTSFLIIKEFARPYVLHYSFFCFIAISAGISIIHIPLTLFSPHLEYVPYWVSMFFDPMVQVPMQWFSFSPFPATFFIMLFLLPLLVSVTNGSIRTISYVAFWSIVLLFVFKYFNAMGYAHSRYLYFLYPYYILGFALSLYYYGRVIFTTYYRPFLIPASITLMALCIIIPTNSLHASRHDLTIWGVENTDRQPTASGNRTFFLNVIDLLKTSGITKDDAVVIQGEGYSYLSWYLQYPLTRRYTTTSGDTFEIGDKVFLVDTPIGVDELDSALEVYTTGFLVWHSSKFSDEDFDYKGHHFTFLGISEGYKLFRWSISTSTSNAL